MNLKLRKNRRILEIKFVSESDKTKILECMDPGLIDKLTCEICKEKVNKNNIGILTEKGGRTIVICNKPECMKFNRLFSNAG